MDRLTLLSNILLLAAIFALGYLIATTHYEPPDLQLSSREVES